MKIIPELHEDKKLLTKTEIVDPHQKEKAYIGSLKLKRGHKLFEYNTRTNEIREAPVQRKVIIGMDKKKTFKSRIETNRECLYVGALNVKNAKKHFEKMIKEILKQSYGG